LIKAFRAVFAKYGNAGILPRYTSFPITGTLMEMYQIRYFLAVCETLNFTRAAEKCFVSQPSLTKAIQKLEDNLGGRLFDRTKNSVQLTELGRVMQPHLAQLYGSARNAREQARSFFSAQPVRLTLGIMCTLCLDPLIGMLLEFQMKYPKVELRFDEGTLEGLTDALDKSEVDAAIMSSPYEFPKRFEAVTLYREEYVVACPPNHRLLPGKRILLPELQGEKYVSRENWIQTMVRAGLGVSFMPENSCLAADLAFCRIAEPEIRRDIRLLTPAGREKPMPVQSFLDQAARYDWRRANKVMRKSVA
jgi:DNA-binding transcriptional LysR family regulator